MRKGQLIKRVIKDYRYHIKYIQENFGRGSSRELTRYLVQHHIGCGICNYMSSILPSKYQSAGYGAKWVKKYYVSSDTWDLYPICNVENIYEVVRLLQSRVDIMEKELLSGDKLQQRLDSKQYLD